MDNKKNIVVVVGLMLVGAFARLMPHMPNFTPTEGLAIFGAAYLGRKYLAIGLTVAMIYFSDFIINNTIFRSFFPDQEGIIFFAPYMIFSIIAIFGIVILSSSLLKKINIGSLVGATVLSSVLFFLVTNFGSWIDGVIPYTKDMTGLMAAYVAGLPFFKTTLISNLVFVSILFGSYELIKSLVSQRNTATEGL